jgi:Zn-dependent peptidase ImmA (M78 family)
MTQHEQIISFYKQHPGMTALEVSKKLNVSKQAVYSATYLERKKAKTVAKRPFAKHTSVKPEIAAVIAPLKSEIEASRITQLERDLRHCRTIISYLERQLGLKDSHHGASI